MTNNKLKDLPFELTVERHINATPAVVYTVFKERL